ncbi:MAG: alanine--tRNA ligase [Chloroflexi bacterium]|nr:alanine--tRNA ligase [Chloroflexota bacterium]MCL5108099.1 alanine--tRNA ligase [Chloroflexota bacterium]
MHSSQVRRTFLEFFREKGHLIVPSSSLIPHGDPTLLLTSAGMVQMKPYFMGEVEPPSRRLTSSQKCFRTTDIEQVGNERSLTFFEMLGNFSVGDYFKEGAISFAWELTTERFGLPADRIWITVHPTDEEALAYWRDVIGIPAERIVKDAENWWGPAGETGPCGPDSELYLDRGEEFGCDKVDCRPGCDCERFLEFWNLVFMQFNQDEQKRRPPLAMQCIDTGLGLERMSMILQGTPTVYETDLFMPIVQTAADLAGVRYGNGGRTDYSLRVIADHSRAVAFLVCDGVLPNNEGRGYILRRVLRRAVRHGRLLGIEGPFLGKTVNAVIELMADAYPDLRERRTFIDRVVSVEEAKFNQTLSIGLNVLDEVIAKYREQGIKMIPGEEVFRLHDTYGFPRELTAEMAAEQGMEIDLPGFEAAMSRQREQARRTAKFGLGERPPVEIYQQLPVRESEFRGYQENVLETTIVGILANGEAVETAETGQDVELVLRETPFYAESGGQVGDIGQVVTDTGRMVVTDAQHALPGLTIHKGTVRDGRLSVGQPARAKLDLARRLDTARNHTATHLLHRALREVLGTHVQQRGSFVGPERLRFDFSHFEAMTPAELRQVSQSVNERIRDDLAVSAIQTSYAEAVAAGAMALFGEKYGESVRMVSIGDYSRELCGGTHLHSTGQIGLFLILSESSIGGGTRRIEALTGRAAERYVYEEMDAVAGLQAQLQTHDLPGKVSELQEELHGQRRQVQQLQRRLLQQELDRVLAAAQTVDGITVVAAQVDAPNRDALRDLGDMIKARLGSGVVVLATVADGKPAYLTMVTADTKIHAGNLVRQVASVAGGGGGGRPDLGQAGGGDPAKVGEALASVPRFLKG